MGIEAGTPAPQDAEEFSGKKFIYIAETANEVARILEGPAKPTNPRYENRRLGVVSDLVVRTVPGEEGDFKYDDLTDVVKASSGYLNAAKTQKDAATDKSNKAAFLIGVARRFPWFRGVGFKDAGTSATIVEIKQKKIPDENIEEVVSQAGVELQTFATQQIQLTADVPVNLVDRRGKPLSTNELQRRMGISIGRMLRPEDRGIYKFTRTLNVHNWKRLAELVRKEKIDHKLIYASEELVVKPIPLSSMPKEEIADTSEFLTKGEFSDLK